MNVVKIAVTGGIGSGKSFVLQIIKDLGYNVVSCDEVYANLLNNTEFVNKVSLEMGVEPLIVDKKAVLNRKAISEKVFNDKALLKKLNSITHGCIFEGVNQACVQGLNFVEVPLLFEGGYQSLFDHVFVVKRDIEKRISSAMARDGATREEVERKIKNQFDYESADLSLHTIINNDGDACALKDIVIKAIKEIENK